MSLGSLIPHSLALPVMFCLVGFLLGSLGCGKQESPAEVISSPPVREPLSAEAIGELLNVDVFKAAYISANGGWKVLNGLESKKIKGRIEIDGKIQPFFMLKKKHGQALLSFEYPDHQLTFGVDGDDVWQRLTVDGQEPSYTRVEGTAADSFISTARFYDPLMSLIVDGGGTLLQIEKSQWEKMPCLKGSFSNEGSDVKIQVYVDPTTMTVMARLKTSPDGLVNKVIYSDYREVSGVMEPFHLESYINGDLEYRMTVDSLRTNVGVMKELFTLPEQVIRVK